MVVNLYHLEVKLLYFHSGLDFKNVISSEKELKNNKNLLSL